MSDIGLTWITEQGAADFVIENNDFEIDDGLETAVYLSLFTDARAEESDSLPSNDDDLRGWWADTVDDQIGSKLWLLSRSKETSDFPGRAKQYAINALQWMIADKLAARVDAQSEIVDKGTLSLTIQIYRPDGKKPVNFRYNYNWAAQAAKVA